MRVLMTSVLLAMATTIASACPVTAQHTAVKAAPMVASPGKGTAGIAVDYRLHGKPSIGQSLRLDVMLETADAAGLVVEVNAPAGLGLDAGRVQRKLASGDTLSLDLVPQAQGRFYVNVMARNAGNGLARVVSIPVQVGVATSKASRAAVTPAGERIVRLPAAE